jgi:tRNA-dihydrouridine synthase B
LCGVTDAVFRRICLERGAGMAVTEMVSSEAFTRGRKATVRSLKGLDVSQGPLSLQIFGAAPERMGETAARLSELGPDYIDMNFGCPARKIVAQGGGSAVLKDLALLARICRAVVGRSHVPVSAKIRAGWDKPSGEGVRRIARAIEDAGVSMLTVHARTRTERFEGEADWDLIAEAKDAVSIPVVGNGDVTSVEDFFGMYRQTGCDAVMIGRGEDFFGMYRQTGCDAVMIGRGAIGNPWIFEEIRAILEGTGYTPPSPRERVEVLLAHVRRTVEVDGEPHGVVTTRKVTSAYVKHLPGARELRGKMMQATRLVELEDLLHDYMEKNAC